MLKRTRVLILLILCIASVTACKKGRVSPEEDKTVQQNISDNDWMHESEFENEFSDEGVEDERIEESSEQNKTIKEGSNETKTDEKTSESNHTNEIEEHDHHYKVTREVQASCTEDGFTVYTCSCGDTYKENTEATGHQWSSWKKVNEKKQGVQIDSRRTCKDCGEIEEKTTIELPPI